MNRRLFLTAAAAFFVSSSAALAGPAAGYAILVSSATAKKPEWKAVIDKLAAKNARFGPKVLTWEGSPESLLPELHKLMPRFTCLVATPEEAGAEFILTANRMTRQYDADPYTDTFWGVLTGYDAENALAIASEEKPLTIHSVGSGTEIAFDRCESGTAFSELDRGKIVTKKPGEEAATGETAPDTTKALVDLLDSGSTDLWVTSGHATERDWQIGFRYKNGYFKSKAGQLFGEDTTGAVHNVSSSNPKVYLPVGNCLMGHIDGPDAMALAYMKSASIRQMIGYIEPTWYGYQGWGMLDYFLEQPGRFTMNEAWRANNQALVNRLETYFPGTGSLDVSKLKSESDLPAAGEKANAAKLTSQDLQGLLFDRDHVAFYGDPAWEARMAKGKLNWDQSLTIEGDGTRTLTIKPLQGAQTFATVNSNGSQRGGRPVIQFFDQRIDPASVKITTGAELNPVITDDFILVPLPSEASGTELKIQFTATAAQQSA